jgi:hypothetical protein
LPFFQLERQLLKTEKNKRDPYPYIFSLVVVLVFGIFALSLIKDPDFFWHMATGKWIVQNHAIPASDPFSFTTATTDSRVHFVLSGYWPAQVLYYALYSFFGMNGIFLLKMLLIAGIGHSIYIRGRESDRVLHLALTLLAGTALFKVYPLERPHVFSFLFFSMLLYLIPKFTKDPVEKKNHFLLGALMLIWANMHPGVIVGQAVLLLYLCLEGVKFISPGLKPMKKGQYKTFALAVFIGIICSLISPNTYRPVIELLRLKELSASISENQPPLGTILAEGPNEFLLYFLLLSLSLAAIIYKSMRKEVDITEIALFAGLAYASATHIRYVPFFLIWAAVPVIPSMKELPYKKIMNAAALGVTIAGLIYFIGARDAWKNVRNIKKIKTGDWINRNFFPEEGARFIKSAGLNGNMFNFLDWGGYLIWELYPERKVFIDGRQIDREAYNNAVAIINAEEEISYRRLLDYYQVNYVLIPLAFKSGEMTPLAAKLLQDPAWSTIYGDDLCLIFLRNAPENGPILGSYSIPKEQFIFTTRMMLERTTRRHPSYVAGYITKGDFYLSQAMRREAGEAYNEGLRIAPFNPLLRERLDWIARPERSPFISKGTLPPPK